MTDDERERIEEQDDAKDRHVAMTLKFGPYCRTCHVYGCICAARLWGELAGTAIYGESQ